MSINRPELGFLFLLGFFVNKSLLLKCLIQEEVIFVCGLFSILI